VDRFLAIEMVKRKVGAIEKIDADLSNLQYKVRRDPLLYVNNTLSQYRHYNAIRQLVLSSPSVTGLSDEEKFREQIDFLAHVADCYPKELSEFPQQLVELLTLHHVALDPDLCEKLVGSLVLLRRKDLVDSSS
jgi:protein SDA1